MQSVFNIRIENKVPAISMCREKLLSFCRKNKISKDCMFGLLLAIDELLMNIILYGYDDDEKHFIFLEIIIEDKTIRTEITDDGKPFNPCEFNIPDMNTPVELRTPGGLGIFLAQKYVDSFEYSYVENQNVMKLVKSIF